MHIAYVGPMPPIPGGIAQHGRHVVDALRAGGHTVDVLSWRAQYPRFLYRGEQVDVTAAPPSDVAWMLRWWSPRSWWRAGRVARRADLVVIPWVTPVLAIPLVVLLLVARRPALAIVHNAVPHEKLPFQGPLTRLGLGAMGGAIAHSTSVVADIERLAPGLAATVVPMPPLVDVTTTPLPPTPPLRLLFLGYVRPYKGLDVAIEALALLRARGHDAHLTVAGDFWEPVEGWAARVAALELDSSVDLRAGYVPDDAVGPLLAAHHLLVAPYHSATQSGVVPLAYAAGRPAAATAVGGLVECVDDGVTGVLAPPGDPAAFADALERAAGDLPRLAAGATAAGATWDDVAAAITSEPPTAARSLLDVLPAVLQRGSDGEGGAAGTKRPNRKALAAALVLFVAATTLGLRSLPPIEGGIRWGLLALAAGLVLVDTFVNGAEYGASAALAGHRVPITAATRVAIVAQAANLLPIPGAALVRTRALHRLGSSLRAALGSTAVVGLAFAAMAMVVAGTVFALAGELAPGAVFVVLGAAFVAGVVMLGRRMRGGHWPPVVGRLLAVELASVGVKGLRIYVIVRALGFDISVAQAAALMLAGVLTLAIGVFPGGLGLREALSAALAPIVGLGAAVGTVGAALDRVVGLTTLTVVSGALAAADAIRRPGATPEEDQ